MVISKLKTHIIYYIPKTVIFSVQVFLVLLYNFDIIAHTVVQIEFFNRRSKKGIENCLYFYSIEVAVFSEHIFEHFLPKFRYYINHQLFYYFHFSISYTNTDQRRTGSFYPLPKYTINYQCQEHCSEEKYFVLRCCKMYAEKNVKMQEVQVNSLNKNGTLCFIRIVLGHHRKRKKLGVCN